MNVRDGGFAFPFVEPSDSGRLWEGMTLRDYLAAKAMAALIHSYDTQSRLKARVRGIGRSTDGEGVQHIGRDMIASEAYAQADAMLRAREARS